MRNGKRGEVQDWNNPGCGKDVVKMLAITVIVSATLIISVLGVGSVMS